MPVCSCLLHLSNGQPVLRAPFSVLIWQEFCENHCLSGVLCSHPHRTVISPSRGFTGWEACGGPAGPSPPCLAAACGGPGTYLPLGQGLFLLGLQLFGLRHLLSKVLHVLLQLQLWCTQTMGFGGQWAPCMPHIQTVPSEAEPP